MSAADGGAGDWRFARNGAFIQPYSDTAIWRPRPLWLTWLVEREDRRDGGVAMAWVEQCGNRSWRVRYRRDDDSIGAVSGFPTKAAATAHAQGLEVEQREGRFIDPAAGRITVAEWSQQWLAGVDVAIRTEDFYRSMLRCHIVPRWGGHALTDVSGVKVQAWANELRGRGYARVTVTGIVKLLSLMLARRGRGTADPGEPDPGAAAGPSPS